MQKAWATPVSAVAGNLAVGDTVNYVIGWHNDTGAAVTACSIYVSPYGTDATPGLGARVSQVAQWRQVEAVLPNLNPLDILSGIGTSSPSSGDWTANDRVLINAVAGGSIGKVCVASGTPGTWKDYGAISA